jgi:branched-chain amino acid transport system ATP-binding protein
VLSKVSIDVFRKQKVGILGPNGAGKSTLINAIMGVAEVYSGQILFNGKEITKLATEQRSKLGIACVVEGRRLFPKMTVLENLQLAGENAGMNRDSISDSMRDVYSLFRRLEERKSRFAETLSGGEQQMLAVGRALMSKPSLLLLDEPSQGLAPKLVSEVYEVLNKLRDRDLAMVVVEQQVGKILSFSDVVHVIDHGQVVYSGDPNGSLKLLDKVYIA